MLSKLLSSDAYTPVNKFLAKKFWFVVAWYFGELIRQRDRFWESEFFFSQKQMEKELWFSEHEQRKSVKELSKAWFISVERKWNNNQYFFQIHDVSVLQFFDHQCLKKSTTSASKNQAHNNKEIIINNNKNKDGIIKLKSDFSFYQFVDEFLDKENPQIKYQIEKQWESYIQKQYMEIDKLLKDWYSLEAIQLVLQFVKQSDFRSKNILSIKKLRDKDKNGIPYVVRMIDEIKKRKPQKQSVAFIPWINW